MFLRNITDRLLRALLAVAIIVATIPAVASPASAKPCDCQSMQMHGASMVEHTAPQKQQNAPCSDTQNCVCAVSCGMALAQPQEVLSRVSAASSEKLIWLSQVGGPGLNIKPAIPPPILLG